MSINIAINGFGRIGRYIVRACLENEDIKIVAINSTTIHSKIRD